MDTNNKYLDEIKNMIEKENNIIYMKLTKIMGHADYLLCKGLINEEEYALIEKSIPKTSLNVIENFINDLIDNRVELSKNYQKIIELSNNYEFDSDYFDFDDKNLEKYLIEFLKYTNCYKLYRQLKKMGNIFPALKDESDYCGNCIYNGKYSYIVYENDDDKLVLYDNLAHEMGHALVFNTLDANFDFSLPPEREIISILFEKMFLDFLLENSSIDKEVIKKHIHLVEEKYLDATKDANKAFEIINNPKAKYSFVKDELSYKEKYKKKNISMYDNYYAIGNIISDKLLIQHDNDKEYFIRQLPNLIKEIRYMSTKELIEKHTDFDLVEKVYNKHLVKKI